MSTTRIILICSGKGGVGKTTTTANLGIALARQGAKTVVLDADFGLRNLDLLLGLENRIVYTAQEVLAETAGETNSGELVKEEYVENVSRGQTFSSITDGERFAKKSYNFGGIFWALKP